MIPVKLQFHVTMAATAIHLGHVHEERLTTIAMVDPTVSMGTHGVQTLITIFGQNDLPSEVKTTQGTLQN